MTHEPWRLSAIALRRAFAQRALSPREVVDNLADRIQDLDPIVLAFTAPTLELALDVADERTEELVRGEERGVLHGVPVVVKELFDVEATRTTYGSMVFRDRIARKDAEAVRRLRAAGAVVLGSTRSHEFGWGITTQHHELGSTRNPWDLGRVPGGSSGGAAAAIAAGMVPLALGSDTGGSIRIPAAMCGVAGLKPTHGRVSARGAVALAPSLDHPGPLARDVRDLELALAALIDPDVMDPKTFLLEWSEQVQSPLDGIRVGVVPDLHVVPLSPDHQAVFDHAVDAIASLGADVVDAPLPAAGEIRPTFATIQMAEAYRIHTHVLRTFPERASEYGEDVRGRLDTAAKVTLDDYLEATERRSLIRRRFEVVLEEVDVLLTPVSAGGPSSVDAPDTVEHLGEEIPFRDLVMAYTVPQNLTGLPACSVRAGFDADGLPVGIQVTAEAGREDLTIRVALALQLALADDGAAWPAVAELT